MKQMLGPQENKRFLIFAPLHGVTDAPMRALFTEFGAFDLCVTEFLRVSQEIPPDKTLLSHVPELHLNDGLTAAQTPVQVQLLGGHPDRLARTACRLAQLGARAIDLNFGCPAPTVNRHDGGAVLLKEPQRIEDIVRAVRTAVPAGIPVSAKLRLGWDSAQSVVENALRAQSAGADWITIHARTRMQGYAPPVDWRKIREVRHSLSIPVVANGDIWDLEQFHRCRDDSGADHFMLGRGVLGNPYLLFQIEEAVGVGINVRAPLWPRLMRRFVELYRIFGLDHPDALSGRMKQWLRIATLNPIWNSATLEGPSFPLIRLYQKIKTLRSVEMILEVMDTFELSEDVEECCAQA